MTVAETPGRFAVADNGANCAVGIHAHVGRFTTFGAPSEGPGEEIIAGRGSLSMASAVSAAWRTEAADGAPGTHMNGVPAGT